jgi:hypothetical protein
MSNLFLQVLARVVPDRSMSTERMAIAQIRRGDLYPAPSQQLEEEAIHQAPCILENGGSRWSNGVGLARKM